MSRLSVARATAAHRIVCVLLRVPGFGRLYGWYLDLRYGPDEWMDTYGEDPLGGAW